MKGRPVDQLVYEYLFPKARASDPPNFQVFLQRCLVPEVRHEVHAFYGHLDTQEAKYPGLDYCHPTHRIRLSRWQWHRRLFRAFDGLRLTPHEIATLTKWEGTKWAKERYEKEQGVTIRDTAADEFSEWVPPHERRPQEPQPARQVSVSAEAGGNADETMAEDSDEELASVGVDLNERLRERVALRNVSGDLSTTLDEEWEQWLKNAIETGGLPGLADQIARAHSAPMIPGTASVTQGIFPPRMMAAARNGHWADIPEYLHPMIRQLLQSERHTIPSPLGLASQPYSRPERHMPNPDHMRQPPASRAPRRGGSRTASLRADRIMRGHIPAPPSISFESTTFEPGSTESVMYSYVEDTRTELWRIADGTSGFTAGRGLD